MIVVKLTGNWKEVIFMSASLTMPLSAMFAERVTPFVVEGSYDDRSQKFQGLWNSSSNATRTHCATDTGGHNDVDQDDDQD